MQATRSDGRLPAWRRWLPRLGALATLFTTACCVGLPAAVSLVSAVGAGFLLTDRYLQPLLIGFLLVTVGASALTFRRHRSAGPLLVTVASGAVVYWFIYRDYRVPIVWAGVAALIAAQVWDVFAVRTCAPRSSVRAGTAGVDVGGG